MQGRPSGPAVVAVVDIAQVPQLATRVLIAVSDQGIEPVAEALASAGMRSGAALHTCGARGPDALRALGIKGVACGMLHPLQTIMTAEQGVNSFAEATFGLSGDREATLWADEIVEMVRVVTGGDARSLHIDADRLSYYHAGAVMAQQRPHGGPRRGDDPAGARGRGPRRRVARHRAAGADEPARTRSPADRKPR